MGFATSQPTPEICCLRLDDIKLGSGLRLCGSVRLGLPSLELQGGPRDANLLLHHSCHQHRDVIQLPTLHQSGSVKNRAVMVKDRLRVHTLIACVGWVKLALTVLTYRAAHAVIPCANASTENAKNLWSSQDMRISLTK